MSAKKTKNKSSETPLMKQYNEIKGKHPDALLLFRVGDFYETFGKDAIRAAKILGIVLTKRKNGAAATIELAGFPHHALETYLPKLVRAGERVAICDQLEDPKLTKKIVKRGITELVTPGVSFNDHVLQHKSNNFLAAVHFEKEKAGIAFLDISTGEFLTAEGHFEYVDKLLQSLAPSEVLIQRNQHDKFTAAFGHTFYLYHMDDWAFTADFGHEILLKHFQTNSLKGFGIQSLKLGIIAAGTCLQYLKETEHHQTQHINKIARIEEDRYVWLDRFTIRNLELFFSPNEQAKTLLEILDLTVSPMGSRLLRRWLALPLKDAKAINNRLDAVDYLVQNETHRNEFRDLIHQMGDLERLISKVAVKRVTPRDVLQLQKGLELLVSIKNYCDQAENHQLNKYGEQINLCLTIQSKIGDTVKEDAPNAINKGNVIQDEVDAELDDLRKIAFSSKDYLLQLQQKESEITGIPSLKIAFNNVFGYYFEVRNTHRDKVPTEWIRKQTLVNAERYITEELKEYESKILGAEEKIQVIENRIFNELIEELIDYIEPIQVNAQIVSALDCLQSFAALAVDQHYSKPEINDTLEIEIKEGRHPVIEQQLPLGEEYISNDIYLNNGDQQIIMITGPNMSGKSALLRQTALITLMAQMGAFVPAKTAKIGLVDKIFTRVGASDNISMGESTFMVEMNETASILNNLSERSLILLDEIGRGTSTYDGISIAWAIARYLHEHNTAPKTLFATHYHELNEMAQSFERIFNYNVSIREVNQRIIFLRKLVEGGSNHSFGIHVAKLAGMPKSVIEGAETMLLDLENHQRNSSSTQSVQKVQKQDEMQLSFFQLDDPTLMQIKDEIMKTDINTLTPVEALMKLNEIKKMVKGNNTN